MNSAVYRGCKAFNQNCNHFNRKWISKVRSIILMWSVFRNVLSRVHLTQYEPRYEKPVFCICKNKDADQLRGNRKADQRLCFSYRESTIPLLSKSEISSLKPSSVAVQAGLCQTWSETQKTGFLTTRLILKYGSNCRHVMGLRLFQKGAGYVGLVPWGSNRAAYSALTKEGL